MGQIEELRFDGDAAFLGEWLLFPTSDTTFFSPQDYTPVNVAAKPDGTIEALVWAFPGGEYRIRRVSP